MALSLLCALLLVGIVGFYIYLKDGAVTKRLERSAEAVEALHSLRPFYPFIRDKICLPEGMTALRCQSDTRENPKYLLIGDSQSEALYPGLLAESQPGERWVNTNLPGLIFLGGLQWKDRDFGRRYNSDIKTLVDSHVTLVLIVNSLNVLESETFLNIGIEQDSYSKSRFEGLSETIDRFEKAGKQVVLMIPVPWPRFDPLDCLIGRPFRERPSCFESLLDHETELKKVREMFVQLKRRHPNLLIYDPTPALCSGGRCNVIIEGKPAFRDGNHISDYGADLVAKDFIKWLHALERAGKPPSHLNH